MQVVGTRYEDFEDCGCLFLMYEFIFESVYLGDGFHLAVMLPKFLRTWSDYEFDVCVYIYMDDFSGEYVTL